MIQRYKKRTIKYMIVGASGFGVDLGFLYLFTQYGHVWYIASEIIATFISFCTNYTFNTLWTYRDAMKALEAKEKAGISVALKEVK